MSAGSCSVYVHIPFCEQRCYYCAFTVAVAPEATWTPYVDRVLREADLACFDLEPETIYFGGGTPSLLPSEQLERLIRRFRGSPCEITVEANPGTLSLEKVLGYRQIGVTRVSLGAQSLENEDLRKAGRLHSARDVQEDFSLLRRAGFQNINIDLIAGLPRQNFDVWVRNVDQALLLRPEHISIYMLDAEERSAWGKRPPDTPTDEDFARFYLEASHRLQAAGYIHYEISNWALPGHECVHNLRYWNGSRYRGFGVSAHSYEPSDSHRRFWNTSALPDYAKCVDAGRLPVQQDERLTREMRLEEAVMLGLRRISGFDVARVAKELDIQFPAEWYGRVHELERSGWIKFDGAILRLTEAGWVVASSITEELLWPMPTSIFEATP